MANKNGGAVFPTPPNATPIIGQRFLEKDIPAGVRKIPEGVPLPLAGLFHGDKEQLDRIEEQVNRIEAEMDRLLTMLELAVHMVQGNELAREQLSAMLPSPSQAVARAAGSDAEV